MAAGATGSADELFDIVVDELFDDCRLLDELCDEPSSESIDVSTGGMVTAATGGVDELFNADELFDDRQFLELFDEPLSE